jgi:serine/threonine protein kinase
MPVFGEYETVGDPLSVCDRNGQTRTCWKANRPGWDDERVYMIKSLALPRPGSTREQSAQQLPPADVGADFFESIARLKEAHRACPELIAPIHAFGRTDAELWYATDYYPRQSLEDFYSTASEINDQALRNVVYSVASGCMALRRATGLSHGNLKPSNVLVSGKPGPLKLAQLRLIDVAGSASVRTSITKPRDSRQTITGAALRQATEARDLRGIGEILLKLVENYSIEGPADYSLPIAPSAPWRVLGEHSHAWLGLCNRLLDPSLSLDEISLDSLAKDFEPKKSPPSRTIVLLAAFGLLLVGGIASFPLWNQPLKQISKASERDAEKIASTQPRYPSHAESSVPDTETSEPASPPSSRAGNNIAAIGETDSALDMEPARDMTVTSEQAPPIPDNSDSGREGVRSSGGTADPQPLVIEGTDGPVDSPDFGLATRAPASGLAPGSWTGEAGGTGDQETKWEPVAREPAGSPNSEQASPVASPELSASPSGEKADLQPQTTGARSETAIASWQPARSAAPPPWTAARAEPERANSSLPRVASNPERTEARPQIAASRGQEAGSKSKPARPVETGASAPAQPGSDREPRTPRLTPGSPAQRMAQRPPRQVEVARAETGQRRTSGRTNAPKPAPRASIDVAQLDKQLQKLETEVARVVALRRNSDLFPRVESLEAQYTRANQLSEQRKKRLDLLRANMEKKLPGASPQRAINEPLAP